MARTPFAHFRLSAAAAVHVAYYIERVAIG